LVTRRQERCVSDHFNLKPLETASERTQLSPIPEGQKHTGEGAMEAKELYREALDCLAKASNLLTEAKELELAGAVYELSLDVETAWQPRCQKAGSH
jgi:hypothetical protein